MSHRIRHALRTLPCAVFALSIHGCAVYGPAQLDPKTNQYGTFVEVDKAAFREYQTDVDPRGFRFIVLTTRTNTYPARFEFFARNALADLGLTHVLNRDELVHLVKSHPQLAELTSISDPLALARISKVAGPVMLVDFASLSDGNARRLVALRVTDAGSGRVLLRIEQNKMIWADTDTEVHLPMLNALRQWFKASTGKAA